MRQERWCQTGQHWKPVAHFRTSTNGRPARDCHDCEIAKLARPNARPEPPRLDSVDIDAIHYKLGAIRKPQP